MAPTGASRSDRKRNPFPRQRSAARLAADGERPMKPNHRSTRWFDPDDFRTFGQRSRMAQMGYAQEEYRGRPVIGILNTWSDINQCHAHFKTRVEDVKRGVLQAGGFPIELPAISLSEVDSEADDHALPQFPGDGDGGADPLPSHRRRRPHGRLRQDHAGPAARGHQRRRSRDLLSRRADAARQLARPRARLRLRRLQILGGAPRRQHHRRRLARRSRTASPAPTASA